MPESLFVFDLTQYIFKLEKNENTCMKILRKSGQISSQTLHWTHLNGLVEWHNLALETLEKQNLKGSFYSSIGKTKNKHFFLTDRKC